MSLATAIGSACASVAGPLAAQAPAPTSTTGGVPVSATSQCVEGPGAPPADPTKVTRVVPAAPGAPAAQGTAAPAAAPTAAAAPGGAAPAAPAGDAPGAPVPVLLELGAGAGASVRFDDAPTFVTSRRVGFALGGSVHVLPSRVLGFGLGYTHAGLGRIETPPSSPDVVTVDHDVHTLIAEARVSPFRFDSLSLFAAVGGGLAWQTAKLRAAFAPLDGQPGGSFRCDVGSNAEFAFRVGLGVKARMDRGFSFLADAAFTGYRLSADVLDACAPGAGTAQTLLVRVGFTYDVDISRLVR